MKYLLILSFSLILACQPVLRKIMGVKKTSFQTIKDQKEWGTKMEIDKYPYLSLDTGFNGFISEKFSDFTPLKAFVQPIQIYCIDFDGSLLSFTNNCYFPGVRNTGWNVFGAFDSFPAASSIDQLYLDSLSFYEISKWFKPLNSIKYDLSEQMIVIFVNKTFERMSKSLIKNMELKYPEMQKAYVNSENFLFYMSGNDNISFK